jgi:hypothetical protein
MEGIHLPLSTGSRQNCPRGSIVVHEGYGISKRGLSGTLAFYGRISVEVE